MQIYYKVIKGTVLHKGKRYPEGAEFPASDKDMRDLRAQGAVTRITPHIVYRRAMRCAKRYEGVHGMRQKDSLWTMPTKELSLLRMDQMFYRRFGGMFPELNAREIRAIRKPEMIRMIIEKRGF